MALPTALRILKADYYRILLGEVIPHLPGGLKRLQVDGLCIADSAYCH
jgi:hypothetical protein